MEEVSFLFFVLIEQRYRTSPFFFPAILSTSLALSMMRSRRRLLLNIAGLSSAAALSTSSLLSLAPRVHLLPASTRCRALSACGSPGEAAAGEAPAVEAPAVEAPAGVRHSWGRQYEVGSRPAAVPPGAVQQYTRDPLDTTEIDVSRVEDLLVERSLKRPKTLRFSFFFVLKHSFGEITQEPSPPPHKNTHKSHTHCFCHVCFRLHTHAALAPPPKSSPFLFPHTHVSRFRLMLCFCAECAKLSHRRNYSLTVAGCRVISTPRTSVGRGSKKSSVCS